MLIYFNADLAFYFNADPDPAPHQSDADLRPLVYRPPGFRFEPILYASILSVHGPPWFRFEPLKLMNFDCNADRDPAFSLIRVRIQLSKIMPIRIRIPGYNKYKW
jgi:hypothetical protein